MRISLLLMPWVCSLCAWAVPAASANPMTPAVASDVIVLIDFMPLPSSALGACFAARSTLPVRVHGHREGRAHRAIQWRLAAMLSRADCREQMKLARSGTVRAQRAARCAIAVPCAISRPRNWARGTRATRCALARSWRSASGHA
jgi:hypothetical protein